MGECFLTSRREITADPLIDETRIGSRLNISLNAIAYHAELESFVSITNDKLIRTQDFINWQEIHQLYASLSLFSFGSSLFANTWNDYLFVSNDNCETFTETEFIDYWIGLRIRMARNSTTGTLIMATEISPRGVFVSRDNGHIWEKHELTVEGNHCAVSYDVEHNLFFAALGKYLYKSSDDGETWQSAMSVTDYSTEFLDLGYFPEGKLFCVFNGTNTLNSSSDLGATWQYVSSFGTVKNSDSFFMKLINGRLYCNTTVGLRYSDDDGDSWNTTLDNVDVLDIAVSAGGYMVLDSSRQYHYSHDFVSWHSPMQDILSLHMGANGRILGAAYGEQFYTDNISQGFVSVGHLSNYLRFSTANDIVYLCGFEVHKSTDNGETWETLEDINFVRKISFTNGIYVGLTINSMGYLYKSSDGSNWTQFACSYYFKDMIALGNQFLGVADDGKFYKSDDLENWALVGELDTPIYYYQYELHLCDNQLWFFMRIDLDLYAYSSLDGGVNWSKQKLGSSTSEFRIAALTTAIMIIEKNNVYYLSNGKIHRHHRDVELEIMSLIFDPNDNCYYAIEYDQTHIYLSKITVTKS
jgi:hypothetical protein